MECNVMQCDAMRYKAMQCNVMHVFLVPVMQCNAMQCNAMQCNAMRCNAMQCNAMQCNAMQCNAMQCNAMHVFIVPVSTPSVISTARPLPPVTRSPLGSGVNVRYITPTCRHSVCDEYSQISHTRPVTTTWCQNLRQHHLKRPGCVSVAPSGGQKKHIRHLNIA